MNNSKGQSVVMVGPFPPQKIIAPYLLSVLKILLPFYSVEYFTFKKPYPTFIPKLKKKQTTCYNELIPENLNINRVFVWWNVVSYIKAYGISRATSLCVFFQIAEHYHLPIYFIFSISLRLRGVRTVAIYHQGPPNKFYKKILFPLIVIGFSEIAVHSETFYRLLVRKFPGKKVNLITHPPILIYGDTYFQKKKSLLENKITRVLFFGNIRKYKNVPFMIREFKKLDLHSFELTIAGELHEEKGSILKLIEDVPNIKTYFGFISEKDIPNLFQSNDYLLIPYKTDMFASGVKNLANSFENIEVIEFSKVGELKEKLTNGPKNTKKDNLKERTNKTLTSYSLIINSGGK